ncbi:MAG: TetR family transcriptional regulator [Actinobacteria bacterium]|nr:TetR family transcriptional regulator [Actinomycetota bacterium]
MTEQLDRRADTTRLQILRAASHQFARKPYSLVSLDDILADAEVTKGAMYFHFRSKHALASEIIERGAQRGRATVDEVLSRGLSGMETLIDAMYLVAIEDLDDETARAGFNLLESIGRSEGLQARVAASWIDGFTVITRRAIRENDVIEGREPADIARLLVSMYLGIRQTSDLDDPARFLGDLEMAWTMALPGFANPERLSYLTQFIGRRTALAIRKTTGPADGR